jgi:mRNA (guanine-N7-)-methyltransferase
MSNRVASEYSLTPIYRKEFHEVFTENQNEPEFKQLLVKMGVVDAQGESAMDEDQWDAASTSFGFCVLLYFLLHVFVVSDIYIAFAFQKR